MSLMPSERFLRAAAFAVLAVFLPSAAGCGAAGPAYMGGPPTMASVADESGVQASRGGSGFWDGAGAGFAEPSDRLLAQAGEAVVDVDGTSDVAPVATDAAGDSEAENGEELTWEEIALPEPTRPEQRLVIKNGTVRIELDPPEDGPAKVVEIAGRFGGYVQSSSTTSVVFRVPSESFEDAMAALEEVGKVVDRTISGQDVSEEYYDINVRLRNSLAARQRYLALLAQARNVEEALLVERELERVTLEIEELRGRLRLLRDRISDSTISVYFVAEYDEPEEARPGPIGWIFYGLYVGIKWLFVWD